MQKAMWTSPERVYLDAEGKAVGAKDPRRAQLLVCEGGRIPLDQAQALGLVPIVEEVAEEVAEVVEKAEKPAADKAVKPAQNKAQKPAQNKGK
jgi:hypothetical protein